MVAGLGLAVALTALAAPPAQADVPVATFHEHINFSGINWTQNGPNHCTASIADTDYSLPAMTGFNDVVSSFQGKSACWVKLYEHANFVGATFGYDSWAASIGSMNDRASAYKIS